MSLKFTISNSTGESLCRTPQSLRLRLQNTPLEEKEALLFMLYLNKVKGIEVFRDTRIFFSSRRTKRRWGTCWAEENLVVLYRHVVQTLLHELAHVPFGHQEGHGPQFARFLDTLVILWEGEEWKEFRGTLLRKEPKENAQEK